MNALFADGIVDCLGPFFGIIFFLFITFGGWVMQQIADASKRQAMRRPPAGPPPASPQQTSQQMQDFLRRAAEQTQPGDQADEVTTAEVIAPRALKPSVASHVTTTQLTQHAAQLGEVLDQADERLEQRLHHQFDHAVGALGDSSDSVHEDPSKSQLPKEAVTTREIIDVFRHPERVREAIIMAEILARRV